MASKRNAEKEKEALDWIEAILGEPIDRKKPFEEVLKNGIILCKIIELNQSNHSNIFKLIFIFFLFTFQAQTKPDFNGPILGPKMAEENKREFTQEQLDAGKNVVSLQYGSNQGASQAGLSMGKQRMIAD
ncbi:myophilin [Octopus bimaculoides]|uniref:myophilin n=1 Tax=Octopus bimaculoides TaxID=37653 RepID=UPI0022E927FF|nr:myophilin [Octopus bimaculoides]